MESFVVSARKYRPLGFEEVVGQGHITTTLKNAIEQNQLAQALLFCGPRGVGKTTCARILSRMINGFEAQNGDANTANLNIYELDAASNNSVEDIRNLIDQVRYPPQEGKYKVYIIDEVHMLSNQAFNAFLKTLEEPPSYAIFILATTEKHKVIPTILSRCQIYDFNRIEIEDIVGQLKKIAKKEGISYDDDALHLIAQKSDGALRDALSMFDLIVTFSSDKKITYRNTITHLHILDHDYYFKLSDLFIEQNLSATLVLFDEILKKGFDAHNFLIGLAQHFRNVLVCQNPATLVLLEVSENVKNKFKDQAERSSTSFLLSGLNMINLCDQGYKQSKNQRLHIELCLMKLSQLDRAFKLSAPEEVVKKKSLDLDDRSMPHQKIDSKEIAEGKREKQTDQSIPKEAPDTSSLSQKETPSILNKNKSPGERQEVKEDENTDPVKTVESAAPSLESKSDSLSPTQKETPSILNKNKTESPGVRQEVKEDENIDPVKTVESAAPSLESKPDSLSPTQKETPSIFKKKKDHPPKEDKEKILKNEAFTEGELQEAWKGFIELRKKKVVSEMEQLILTRQITKKDMNALIVLNSSLEIAILDRIEVELVNFLRKTLSNDQLIVHKEVKEDPKKDKLYTSKDKYDFMVKEQPLLQKLKDKLGLDFEY
ncbi:DNA polymerase III subunit gamma/tau [Cyclobacteriaceae bacterium]|nr:DNA polymerase III subunit gamma/tau [Cyclobacteriaceae bacterium]